MKKYILSLMFISYMAQLCSYEMHVVTDKTEQVKLIPFLGLMRLDLFKEYPYLYEGSAEEEKAYILDFIARKDSCMVVVYGDEQVPVGIMTGCSLADYDTVFPGVRNSFEQAGYNPEEFYYCAEAVVLKEHQGNRFSEKMSQLLVGHARDCGYTKGCFASVVPDAFDKQLEPEDYKDIETLFTMLGGSKMNVMQEVAWQSKGVNGLVQNKKHAMQFWQKDLQ